VHPLEGEESLCYWVEEGAALRVRRMTIKRRSSAFQATIECSTSENPGYADVAVIVFVK